MPYLIQPDPHKIATPVFLGFGAEWDSSYYVAGNVTDEDFALARRRVDWMRLPVARVMMQVKWCSPQGGGSYDWNTPAMRALYRILDACQELGTTVFLTDWGCEPGWLRTPGITDAADPHYAEAMATYLAYLRREKGYTCIRYFIMGNEPNFEVKEWARWKKGIENLWTALQARQLDKEVTLVGADESNNEDWHRQAVAELSHLLGGYDIHRYARDEVVRSGQLYDFYRAEWAYARANDPQGALKPCIVGEAGMQDNAQHPYGNDNIGQFWYGVFMADYAIQAVNAGSAAVSAWMLDDNAHQGFFWGLWSDKAHGMRLRPWYYAWGLLCRLFRPGSLICRLPQPAEGLRALAAQLPGGGWSLALVNRSAQPVEALFKLPGEAGRAFQCYTYAKDTLPEDDTALLPALSLPGRVGVVSAQEELSATCPPEAVVFLTTMR